MRRAWCAAGALLLAVAPGGASRAASCPQVVDPAGDNVQRLGDDPASDLVGLTVSRSARTTELALALRDLGEGAQAGPRGYYFRITLRPRAADPIALEATWSGLQTRFWLSRVRTDVNTPFVASQGHYAQAPLTGEVDISRDAVRFLLPDGAVHDVPAGTFVEVTGRSADYVDAAGTGAFAGEDGTKAISYALGSPGCPSP